MLCSRSFLRWTSNGPRFVGLIIEINIVYGNQSLIGWPCYVVVHVCLQHPCYKTDFLFEKSWGLQSYFRCTILNIKWTFCPSLRKKKKKKKKKIKVHFFFIYLRFWKIHVLCATLWGMGLLRALQPLFWSIADDGGHDLPWPQNNLFSNSPYHVIYTVLRTDIGDAVHPRVESKQSAWKTRPSMSSS